MPVNGSTNTERWPAARRRRCPERRDRERAVDLSDLASVTTVRVRGEKWIDLL